MKLLKKINFKEFIKELLILIIIFVIVLLPLPYYITIGGGTIDSSSRIVIAGNDEENHSYELAYVKQLTGTPIMVLLAKLVPSWDLESSSAYSYDGNEPISAIEKRGSMSLDESLQAATKNAYDLADKDFNIIKTTYKVNFIEERNRQDIKVGDEIIAYDGIPIEQIDDLGEYINSLSFGDLISISFKRGDKEFSRDFEIFENEMQAGQKIIGLVISILYDFETDPAISFKFNEGEQGSSGGFMLALSIFDLLVEEDIADGRKIVGTGTIDSEGNIGEIGGVGHKAKGAINAKADIFIVPKANYAEAKAALDAKNSKIKLIAATNLEETINKLKEK